MVIETESHSEKAADTKQFESGIYRGWVRHRRYTPRQHEFKYQVFMMYLDISELEDIFSLTRLWSMDKTAAARFKRSDFIGNPDTPLDTAVREKIASETGHYPTGAIRVLANLRYFGFTFNPITCYYVFDKAGALNYILAEVTNTPWFEKHAYVISCDPMLQKHRKKFSKKMHVSPFNGMQHEYDWQSITPNDQLLIHMRNIEDKVMVTDATLNLERTEITASSLRQLILSYPFMTFKVVGAIYWQALKLYIKKVPVYLHPRKTVQKTS